MLLLVSGAGRLCACLIPPVVVGGGGGGGLFLGHVLRLAALPRCSLCVCVGCSWFFVCSPFLFFPLVSCPVDSCLALCVTDSVVGVGLLCVVCCVYVVDRGVRVVDVRGQWAVSLGGWKGRRREGCMDVLGVHMYGTVQYARCDGWAAHSGCQYVHIA